jgi:hypothetical protein
VSDHPLFDVGEELIDLFEQREIPYFIMGGFAVRLWGLPRPTFDLDFTVDMPREKVPTLARELEEAGFIVPGELRHGWLDAMEGMTQFHLKRYGEGQEWDIDVFLVANDFQRSAMKRRRKGPFQKREVWYCSPEDLVLFKVLAGRPRDHADVLDILLVSGTLDGEYMKKHAKQLDVAETLELWLLDAQSFEKPDGGDDRGESQGNGDEGPGDLTPTG